MRRSAILIGTLTVLQLGAAPNPARAQENDFAVRAGKMITIAGTIDSRMKHHVVREAQAAARNGVETLLFDLQPATSDFGPCLDIAREIVQLGGSIRRTVAFVNPRGPDQRPTVLNGHGLLMALACDEIVMPRDARLGSPIGQQALTEIEQTAYQEIARKKNHPSWLARAMVRQEVGIVEIETPNGKRIASSDELDELAKQVRILSRKPIKEPGQPFLLDAETAKRLGVVRRTAESRRELALAYDLPESIAAEDPLRQEVLKPVFLKLEGAIDSRMHQFVLRRIKQAQAAGNNLVFVEIDSAIGDESAATSIAAALKAWPARKIAWVPRQARGPAIFLVLACDELVMASDARLGGFRVEGATAKEYAAFFDAARQFSAGSKYPEALVRGLVDPESAVYEATNANNPGLRGYKTAAELEDPEVKKAWIQPRPVKAKGTLFEMTGAQARSYDFAQALAATAGELQAAYDIGGRVPVLQPGWVDSLVDGLRSVGDTVFLLVVGMTCLYIEFQMPGFGIAGLISAVCFVLFFWAQYLSGTANSLEIVMFLLGMAFLAVELFVIPGFGITGLAGLALIFVSLVLASQSFVVPRTDAEAYELYRNLITLISSMVVVVVAAVTLARYFPQMPLFSRMMLAPPAAEGEAPVETDYEEDLGPIPHRELVGKVGVAASPLRPAGRMRYGDEFYDVVAQGDFIEPGTKVVVVQVYHNRIVVREEGHA